MTTEQAPRAISGLPPGHIPIAVVDEVRVAVGLDPYLTVKGLAGYSGLSTRTLRDLLTNPHYPLPCYRVNGRILVKVSDFDKWARAFRQIGPPDLDAIADEIVGQVRVDSNPQSGGQAPQGHVTKGRVGKRQKPGAVEAQNSLVSVVVEEDQKGR